MRRPGIIGVLIGWGDDDVTPSRLARPVVFVPWRTSRTTQTAFDCVVSGAEARAPLERLLHERNVRTDLGERALLHLVIGRSSCWVVSNLSERLPVEVLTCR